MLSTAAGLYGLTHLSPRQYGADNYTSGDGTNVWVNAYSSTDLVTWKNEGHAYTHPGPFPCPGAAPTACCGEADRPKVVQRPDGTFIMSELITANVCTVKMCENMCENTE